MTKEQEHLQDILKKRLKEKGLKVTQQRLIVLQILAENRDKDVYKRQVLNIRLF